MSTNYFVKYSDREEGPVAFSELVDLVCQDEVQPDTLVRKESELDWIRAEKVLGLFGAARVKRGKVVDNSPKAGLSGSTPQPVATARQGNAVMSATGKSQGISSQVKMSDMKTASVARSSTFFRVFGEYTEFFRKPMTVRFAGSLVGILLIAVSGAFGSYFSLKTSRFPAHTIKSAAPPSDDLRYIRPSRPGVPSVPNLPQLTSTLVPGLEGFTAASSPALSANLLEIVFVSRGPGTQAADLMYSRRESVNARFSKPQLITTCNSADDDLDPSLSPDGQELVYIRNGTQGGLLTVRKNRENGEFGSPVMVRTQDSQDGLRLNTPQFLDERRVAFGLTDDRKSKRTVWIMERKNPTSAFEAPYQIKLADSWGLSHFASSETRCYFGWKGIFLAYRPSSAAGYGGPVALLTEKDTGAIEGPIYVSRAEDVFFYSSPGPGKTDETRKLWMIRQ